MFKYIDKVTTKLSWYLIDLFKYNYPRCLNCFKKLNRVDQIMWSTKGMHKEVEYVSYKAEETSPNLGARNYCCDVKTVLSLSDQGIYYYITLMHNKKFLELNSWNNQNGKMSTVDTSAYNKYIPIPRTRQELQDIFEKYAKIALFK